MGGTSAHFERHRMGLHTDFEIGPFVPSIGDTDFDGSGEGQAYTLQLGRYRRTGAWVDVSGHLTISDLGTLTTTDAASILGLPFTLKNTTNQLPVFNIWGSSLALPVAQDSLVGLGVINTTRLGLHIWEAATGPNTLLISELSVGATIHFSGSFEIEIPATD